MNTSIARLRDRRDQAIASRKQIDDAVGDERRTVLNENEDREFRSLTDEIREYDSRISELEEQERRSQQAAGAAVRARVGGAYTSSSSVYGPESRNSYFADLVAQTRQTADYDARQRLQIYEMEQRDLNRADGSGGLFVPPAWLINDYVGVPRRVG
jgi:HK97 family phage major capsid protein